MRSRLLGAATSVNNDDAVHSAKKKPEENLAHEILVGLHDDATWVPKNPTLQKVLHFFGASLLAALSGCAVLCCAVLCCGVLAPLCLFDLCVAGSIRFGGDADSRAGESGKGPSSTATR